MATASFGELLVSGEPAKRTFAVYRGAGCLMRGRFLLDGSLFVEPGSLVSMCSGLFAACEQVTSEHLPETIPPPAPAVFNVHREGYVEPQPEPDPDA